MSDVKKSRTTKEEIDYGYDSLFPSRLRKLLEKTTQGELAEACNVARQSVAQWKDGKTKPDIYYLGKIADFFNVSTDYLLGRSDTKSADVNVKMICKYTGLSEQSVETIKEINNKIYTNLDEICKVKLNENKEAEFDCDYKLRKVLNFIFESDKTIEVIESISNLVDSYALNQIDYSDEKINSENVVSKKRTITEIYDFCVWDVQNQIMSLITKEVARYYSKHANDIALKLDSNFPVQELLDNQDDSFYELINSIVLKFNKRR